MEVYLLNKGSNGYYYTINGVHYDDNFPLEWAQQDFHEKKGSQNCIMCQTYGFYRNVFVANCYDCATELKRGFSIKDFNECDDNDLDTTFPDIYRRNISKERIGCNRLAPCPPFPPIQKISSLKAVKIDTPPKKKEYIDNIDIYYNRVKLPDI
jgi:hypothetical protein